MQPHLSRLVGVLVAMLLAAVFLPLAAGQAEAWAADLFFSEYIEGSGNNKALEIYNATGAAVNLGAGGYNVVMYFNGAVTPGTGFPLALTGTVANGDVFVLAHSSAGAAILAQADQTSSANWFNGDDAVVLRKGTTIVDVIGQVGFDPGAQWGTGLTSTEDNTLQRKGTVCAGDTNGSDAFNPATEWDGFAQDTFGGLGAHTSVCNVPPAADPRINEFSTNTVGTDLEYLEILGDPSTDYSAYTILEIEGDGDEQRGTVDEVISVGTTDAGGFYLANLAANALENGTATLLLVRGFTGALGSDLDLENDGVLEVTPWSALVDAVAVDDGGASDLTYGVPALGVAYDGLPFAPGGASRIPDGNDTDTAADWVRNDFDLAGIPGYTGTPVAGEAYNTPGATNRAVDTVPPVVTVPGDMTAEATGPLGAVVSFAASAVDAVDGPVPVSCLPASGSSFPLGATTVTCSATDSVGNIGSASFTVTVGDTRAPVVTVPSDMVVEATGPLGAVVSFVVTAADAVDPAPVVACVPASGSTFPLGTTAVACTGTDAAENIGSASFTVTVGDTRAPVVTVPSDMVVEATGPGGAVVSFTASASDANPPAPAVFCDPGSGSMFSLGSSTVVCSATDLAGNVGSSSFRVTVVDTRPPALTLPEDMTVEATGPSGAAVAFSATATDVVAGARPVSCVPAAGSVFPLGSTTVDCSANDLVGNSVSGSFTVTVRDTSPPVLTLPGDMTVEATGPLGAAVVFSATAIDVVSGSVPVPCLPKSGSTFSLGTRTVRCRAGDAAGNWASGSFRVLVVDTTPPVISLLGDPLLVLPVGASYVEAGATAADLVDGDLTAAVVTVSPVDTATPGDFVVSFDVTDSHGNAAVQVTRRVRVVFFCAGEEATIWGTSGADILVGTAGRDVIVGLGGDDVIRSHGGDDLVCAGGGDDRVDLGWGDDVVYGGKGDDRLAGGPGDDRLRGGAGRDVVIYSYAAGPVTVRLLLGTAVGEGSDVLRHVEGVVGSAFADLLVGGPLSTMLWGGRGDDVLRGGGAGDTLWGGVGDDQLFGNGGDDLLWGGPGNDLLVGGLGHDTLDGTPE